MTTTTKTIKRPIVALKLPGSVPQLLGTTSALVSSMTNNQYFPTPDPPLATVSAAVAALEAAQTAVHARTQGAVAGRNEKRQTLTKLLEQLRAYIQKIADGDSGTAEAVIRSAGVGVRKPTIRQKQAFAVTEGAVSGSVKLVTATAGARASYEWQCSPDGGKTWQALPATLQAKTTMTGLAVGASAQFRSRAVTKTGEADWTQPVSILVR